MLQTSESETEILLGNKQLLGIFFLVAVLLGIAFTGGYMVGRGTRAKKALPVSAAAEIPAATPATAGGGETHSVTPPDVAGSGDQAPAQQPDSTAQDVPLGAAKPKQAAVKSAEVQPEAQPAGPTAEPGPTGFLPQSGEEFLQVTAVARADAESIADTLRSKGFRAHAVPAPNNPNLYRVIVGPVRDAGDLSNTRDALRKTGFRDVIVQHYR